MFISMSRVCLSQSFERSSADNARSQLTSDSFLNKLLIVMPEKWFCVKNMTAAIYFG